MSKTIGEQRVRVDFNPSKEGNVQVLKEKAAEFINILEAFKNDDRYSHDGEVHRLIALGQTTAEEAAMWAVKAVTSYS